MPVKLRPGQLSDGEWVAIPGRPVGKQRPRMTKSGRAYTPQKTQRWESMARAIFSIGWKARLIDGPVRVEIRQVEQRPQRFKGPPGRHPCPAGGTHPDADNVAKIVLDAMTKTKRIWRDDAQVTELICFKVWAAEREGPAVEVRVTSVELDDQLNLWGVR